MAISSNKNSNESENPLPGRAFERLYEIIVTLRNPGGCPWDREQTPQSLRGDLIEEAYECIEAIDDNDPPHIQEELGDLFLLGVMISRMHEQTRDFTLEQVLDGVSEKLVRRHPHVFSEETAARASTPEEVLSQWDDIKENLEGRRTPGILDTVPRSLPPLERALKMQNRVAKKGFDWDNPRDTFRKIREELSEFEELLTQEEPMEDPSRTASLEKELGDILFSVVNMARRYGLDPGLSLERTNRKFSGRFHYIERNLQSLGKELTPENRELMEKLWIDAKENSDSRD